MLQCAVEPIFLSLCKYFRRCSIWRILSRDRTRCNPAISCWQKCFDLLWCSFCLLGSMCRVAIRIYVVFQRTVFIAGVMGRWCNVILRHVCFSAANLRLQTQVLPKVCDTLHFLFSYRSLRPSIRYEGAGMKPVSHKAGDLLMNQVAAKRRLGKLQSI